MLDQVADALEVAHEHGLVHGAIRPENILVAPGDHAYLTNFAGGPESAAADRQALHELRDAALAASPPPEPAQEPEAPRARRPLPIALAVVAVCLIGTGIAIAALSGGDEEPTGRATRPDTGPLPGGNPTVERFSLGRNVAPGEIAVDDNGLYIDDRQTSDLLFVDPDTGKVSKRMKLRGSFAFEPDPFRPDRLWVTIPLGHRILQIDTAGRTVAGRPFRAPGTPGFIGVGSEQLVVTTGDPAKAIKLRRLDKATGRPLGPQVSESRSTGTDLDLAVGINVTHWVGAALLTFDDELGSKRFIDFRIPGANSILGPQASETAIGANDVAWTMVNYVEPDKVAVVRSDLKTKRQIGRMIGLGPGRARDIATADGVVWVPNITQGTVSRIDERTGRLIGKPIRIGEIEGDVVARGGRAWIAGARDLIRITP